MYEYKGFIFPFGLDESLASKINGFGSRWSVEKPYRDGFVCHDKYYRKKCYFEKRNGNSIIVYDWVGQYEPYELARFSSVFFNTGIIKRAPLIEIFPNRWDDARIRVLYNGRVPMEVYFTGGGDILTPYGSRVSSIEGFEKLLKRIDAPEIVLSDGFTVYKTLDADKPFRIVHDSGQYFVIRKGYVESHIPFGRRGTIDRIDELLL